MTTNRLIEAIRVTVYFNDSHVSVVLPPQGPVKIKSKTKFGWCIMLVGLWIIFGRAREFRTVIDPLFTDDRRANNAET